MIGRHGVDHALERGCSVRAMARGAASIQAEHEELEELPGDATDSDNVRRALDAVILALGLGKSPVRLIRPATLLSRVAGVLVTEMETAGPKRLVVVTGYGVGESWITMNALEGLGGGLLLGRAYADKDLQEDVDKLSDLHWTIVRPTLLTNGPRVGEYQVLDTPESWRNGLISRADIAQFLVDRALDGKNVYEAPVLAY